MTETKTNAIGDLAAAARSASRAVAILSTEARNDVLRALAEAVIIHQRVILDANAEDMKAAVTSELALAKLQRLELTIDSLEQMRRGLLQIADLPDPLGAAVKEYTVPSGLHVRKIRAPLGVVMMIYESRPGVTIDAFALCFKAGNACILKGGREAAASNKALGMIAHDVLRTHGVPREALTLFTTSDRDEMRELLRQNESIDLVIPRGAEPLIRFVAEHSSIPTVQHYHGVCHIYVHRDADLEQALEICTTAKTSAPATCNSAECILIDAAIAGAFVPRLVERFIAAGVEVRADEPAHALVPETTRATDDDWGREFLDLIVAVRIVGGIDDAIAHIERNGSSHTEAILTADPAAADRFMREVQSSCVLVNASTRFNDGFQLGLGAEIGISTSRIHAYGPMGLEELTTQRYVVVGSGQTR